MTIDRQPGSDVVAIWVSARAGGAMADVPEDEDLEATGTDSRAMNVNAVVVDLAEDPQALKKVRWLTREAVVVATHCSVLDALPIDGEPLRAADFELLLDETEEQQRRISAALDAYSVRISTRTGKLLKPRGIVRPEWAARPTPASYLPREDTAPHRALATANFVCAAWGYWLATDEERRLRAKASGRTPSRMPPDLSSPVVPDFPPRFTTLLREQGPA